MSTISKKPTKIISIIAVVVFLAIAGLTSYSVWHLSNRADDAKVSHVNGIPEDWSTIRRSNTVISTTNATAQADYISYLVSLENLDSNEPFKVTHIASFVEGESSGFLPFSTSSLEYSYYPNQANSWTPVNIASPGRAANCFQLASALHVGASGSGKSKIYFRFNVAPSVAGNISDKIAFITESVFGEQSLAISDSTVAYEPASSTEVVAVSDQGNNTPADGDSTESAFAAPLGATTADADTSAIPLSSVGIISLPADNNLIIALVVIGSCVILFTLAMIIYLIVRRRTARR